ncbi:alanine/glycine:cation symporter family protein [Isoalcanivorax beigongshangi]|uniref:Alanine/glycine:cation symporter family protein n=1 Tax=Isoalcanivorax beigongshangi TaxID=3238810 RepID=A0ABV4ALD7_9GAMM
MDALATQLELFSKHQLGPPLIFLIGGTGLYLMLRLRGLPLRRLGFALMQLVRGSDGHGTIGARAALAAALAATVGTGNIAGVATAIYSGGPGALVWMWLIGLVGMATKFAEAVLAVQFRQRDSRGEYVGGPMYYIRNGLGPRFAPLALIFAVLGTAAGFGIGNTVQANSVADSLHSAFGIPPLATGLTLMVLVGLVLLGGIRRLARVASWLVPVMALGYLLAGLVVLALHAEQLPAALALIFQSAFTGTAAAGGFAGATVWAAISFGVARGIFSNEAGMGSSPIAHASATTDHPVRQGTIAMLGVFIDTLVICTITGLTIVVTGAWQSGVTGAPLSALAFSSAFGAAGATFVSVALSVFAFTTLLGWSLYSERCAQYLFGVRAVVPFRVVWVLVIPAGAVMSLQLVWNAADVLNGLMAIPNLIALLLLSPIVIKLAREFFAK